MPELATRKLTLLSHHLGRRIRLEDAASAFVDRIVEKAKSDLCLTLGDGWVYLFAFGSVVYINVEAPKAEVFTQDLASFGIELDLMHILGIDRDEVLVEEVADDLLGDHGDSAAV